jgi:hypothetical protein
LKFTISTFSMWTLSAAISLLFGEFFYCFRNAFDRIEIA